MPSRATLWKIASAQSKKVRCPEKTTHPIVYNWLYTFRVFTYMHLNIWLRLQSLAWLWYSVAHETKDVYTKNIPHGLAVATSTSTDKRKLRDAIILAFEKESVAAFAPWPRKPDKPTYRCQAATGLWTGHKGMLTANSLFWESVPFVFAWSIPKKACASRKTSTQKTRGWRRLGRGNQDTQGRIVLEQGRKQTILYAAYVHIHIHLYVYICLL